MKYIVKYISEIYKKEVCKSLGRTEIAYSRGLYKPHGVIKQGPEGYSDILYKPKLGPFCG